MTKEGVCTTIGAIGGAVAAALGGWGQSLITLVVFKTVDFAMHCIHPVSQEPCASCRNSAFYRF